jgi:predicted glutamine amidotransferase
MCRLFGMSGGSRAVPATFWLVDASDSLAAQSVHEPDGTGLGWFEDGAPRVDKEPLEASRDQAFLREARDVVSPTFVAHVRWAYTGEVAQRNTQPFAGDGALFIHQGLVLALDRIEERLGPDRALLGGETDSERIFALIRHETGQRGGDWGQGIAAAAAWLADNVPVFSLNLILATATDLYALRYPDTQPLHVLERDAGGPVGECLGSCLCVRSISPAVVVASECMDDETGWDPLASGELLHVDPELVVKRAVVLDRPPVHRVTLAELDLPEGLQV